MKTQDFVEIELLSTQYEIEISFIYDLGKFGLVEIQIIEETPFIHKDQLSDFEKIVRLYNELEVNIQGIDVILNLLNKVDHLQKEINELKNKLSNYEAE